MINLDGLQKGDTIAVKLINNSEHIGTITCIEPGVRIILNTLLTNMQIPTHMIEYFKVIKKAESMSAIEYLKTKQKLTNGCHTQQACKKCKLKQAMGGKGIDCIQFEQQYPEQAIEIIKTWSKEVPAKPDIKAKILNMLNTEIEALNKSSIPGILLPESKAYISGIRNVKFMIEHMED